MGWISRKSSKGALNSDQREIRPSAELGSDNSLISDEELDLLTLFDAESIVLSPADAIIFQSKGIGTFNLVRDLHLANESLLRLVRATRRSGQIQEATLELPRGPIGAGTHDLLVRVAPEAITRFANRMQTESKRLTDLVQEIINLSRLQDDDPLKRAQKFLVSECVQDALDQSRLNAENRKVQILYKNEIQTYANGDREQITMAIHNLIENAINYSPDGTRVAIAIKELDGICEISITDQGIGIPEKDLERIFERFYRVDPARSRLTGGTGLGLSIVKHIVTNHGGDVSVWSVEGAGSTFTIRLPLLVTDENTTQPNEKISAVEATK